MIESERSQEVPFNSHIWVVSKALKQLKTLKKIGKKLKYIFMPILGLAESFETMKQLTLARPQRFLAAYLSESIKDGNMKFWHNLHFSLKFVLSKFGIYILVGLETMRFSATE